MIWPEPNPTKNAVRVKPIMAALVERSDVTCGNAGVHMSVAKGGTVF